MCCSSGVTTAGSRPGQDDTPIAVLGCDNAVVYASIEHSKAGRQAGRQTSWLAGPVPVAKLVSPVYNQLMVLNCMKSV